MADPLHSLHWLLVVVSVVGVMVVVVAVGDIWSRETRSRRERKKERGIRKRSEKRDQIVAKQIKQGEITHCLTLDGILIRAYSSPYHTNTQILNTGSGRLTEPFGHLFLIQPWEDISVSLLSLLHCTLRLTNVILFNPISHLCTRLTYLNPHVKTTIVFVRKSWLNGKCLSCSLLL